MAFLVTRHETQGRGENAILIAWGECTLCPCGVDGYHVHSSYQRVDRIASIGLHAQNYATLEAAQEAFREQCERLDYLVSEANRDAG